MQESQTRFTFDQECAAVYDERAARWAPIRAALHLLMCRVLSELPAKARILCVGAGTGQELLDLARAFPGWQFTAVEPSAPMLEICRRKAEEGGVASRCTFHKGYLDSLPPTEPFDAATSLLVSQFLLQPEERRQFFCQIADRLRPDGYLVSADLSHGASAAAPGNLMEAWLRMQVHSGSPAEQVAKLPASLERHVAMVAPREMEALLLASGFHSPVQFFQALLIHAWFAQRAAAPAPHLP